MKAIIINQETIQRQFPLMQCPICKSTQVIKSGKHYLKFRKVSQRYKCSVCGSSFTDSGYFKSRFPLQIIQHSIILYQVGFSLEQIQKEIKEKFNRKVSRTAILDWLKKADVKRRPMRKYSGNQKNRKIRTQIEIGISTFVRFTSSQQPEKLVLLHEIS